MTWRSMTTSSSAVVPLVAFLRPDCPRMQPAQVLVLKAGTADGPVVVGDPYASASLMGSSVDWSLQTVAQRPWRQLLFIANHPGMAFRQCRRRRGCCPCSVVL
jgi:hypothetical protein